MAEAPSLTELTASEVDANTRPEVVSLSDERTEDLLGALASSTSRELLGQLRESPTYPSQLADATDTSLQNVHYHLTKLEAAGAVEVVDTVYSKKGREMNVYAPAAEPLVIVSGDETDRQSVANALSKLLGAIGVLALGSVVVQEIVERLFYPGGPTTLAWESGQYAAPPMTNVPPPVGLYIFLAGLGGLLCWIAWRRR